MTLFNLILGKKFLPFIFGMLRSLLVFNFLFNFERDNLNTDTLSGRITAVRGKMSRRAFSNALSIKENTLRNYELGLSLPNSDIIAKICTSFCVKSEWLLFGEGEGPAADFEQFSKTNNNAPSKSVDMQALEHLLAAKQETIVALKDQIEGLKDQVARLQAENKELREEARRGGGVAIHSTAALNFAQSVPLNSQSSD